MEVNITLLFQALIFGVLLLLLSDFLFKPFMRLFEVRELKTSKAIKNAKEILKNNQETNKEIEKTILLAKKEGFLSFVKLKEDALFYHRKIIKKAKEEANKMMIHKRSLLLEKNKKILSSLKNSVDIISQTIIKKVTK